MFWSKAFIFSNEIDVNQEIERKLSKEANEMKRAEFQSRFMIQKLIKV